MSEDRSRAAQGRRTRPTFVIDGEAVVISRRPRAAAERRPEPATETMRPHSEEPETKTGARESFGRRPTRRPAPAPDLVFQGRAARPAADAAPAASRRRGLKVFTDAVDLASGDLASGRGDRRVAGFAGVLALLGLPLLVLSAPIAPAIATTGAETLVIEDLTTSIVPRGAGAVLTVEGRIRNVSGRTAPVPVLRIALAETGGGLRAKALQTGVSRLEAGRALRFHSSVAVAKETEGRVEVGFLSTPAPSGKTHIE